MSTCLCRSTPEEVSYLCNENPSRSLFELAISYQSGEVGLCHPDCYSRSRIYWKDNLSTASSQSLPNTLGSRGRTRGCGRENEERSVCLDESGFRGYRAWSSSEGGWDGRRM